MTMIEEIDKQLSKEEPDSSKEVDLKITKKSRDLLKLCKITMNKSSYDLVILELIKLYKDKIHRHDEYTKLIEIAQNHLSKKQFDELMSLVAKKK